MNITLATIGVAVFFFTQPFAWATDVNSDTRPISEGAFMHRDPHPRLIADLVVEFNPKMDYKLEIPLATETPLEGEIKIRSGKNAGPIKIIHRPRVMIASLEKDVPVTLYLKKYSMRPAYYLIGVFPLGVEK